MPEQNSSNTEDKSSSKHIGVVIPTSFELAPLLALFPQLQPCPNLPWQIYQADLENARLTVIVSFIGPANAAAATERLATLNPDLILHGGAAGAINPELLPGDIVIGAATKIICSKEVLEVRKSLLMSTTSIRYLRAGQAVRLDQLDGDKILLEQALNLADSIGQQFKRWNGPGWPSTVQDRASQISAGVVGSLDGWTKGKEQLQFVRQNFAVDAEDMESAYIAQTAAIHDIPNLAIRAISNNEYLGMLDKSEIIPAVQAAAERVAYVMQHLIGQQ